MRRILAAGLAVFLSLCSVTACGGGIQGRISKELGLEVSEGRQISSYDTHSGNGDGTACMVFQFDGSELLEEIKNNSKWKEFPLDDTVQALVYGRSEETGTTGPYLCDEEGSPLVPEIQNGYYLLIDRQAEKGQAAGEEILHRYSLNFTLGLYDTDTNTLYLCRLDT